MIYEKEKDEYTCANNKRLIKIETEKRISKSGYESLVCWDTILEAHPELYKIVELDITAGKKENNFGRGDSPSVEQIVRAALYNIKTLILF
jgi:hypothetical protein